MSHHLVLKRGGLAIGMLALLVAGLSDWSHGNPCKPATPCPCAADGICRPNTTTWGHYTTRWRTWPGEAAGRQPTPADGVPDDQPQPLPPYETPTPDQEDLRGPAKDKAAKKDRGDDAEAPAELPADEPGQLLPGPGELPAFDPQGSQQLPPRDNQLVVPPMDDAPPALPDSLRQAAAVLNMPTYTTRQPAARPTVMPTIRQAGWQSSPSIQLINPAAAIVTAPEADALQQAIYYEASDLGDAAAE